MRIFIKHGDIVSVRRNTLRVGVPPKAKPLRRDIICQVIGLLGGVVMIWPYDGGGWVLTTVDNLRKRRLPESLKNSVSF